MRHVAVPSVPVSSVSLAGGFDKVLHLNIKTADCFPDEWSEACHAVCFWAPKQAQKQCCQSHKLTLVTSAHCIGGGVYCIINAHGHAVTDVPTAAGLTCRTLRKQSTDKVRKSPRQSQVPPCADHTCSSCTPVLPEEWKDLPDSTPHSKTANKLAALYMTSPGYTPSPVPLRRRLQQQQPGLQEATDQANHDMYANDNIICID